MQIATLRINMFEIRQATIDDIDFVTTSIIGAERSGSNRSLYEGLFDLTEGELMSVLRTILAEEIPGSEFCCDNFLVAFLGSSPVGCIANWVEGATGQSSNFVRATLLAHAVGAEKWARALSYLKMLGEVDIARMPGTMQIEAVYVDPLHRGNRIAPMLIERSLLLARTAFPQVEKVQILSVLGNEASARTFSSIGFDIVRRTDFDNPRLRTFFPGAGRLLWERKVIL